MSDERLVRPRPVSGFPEWLPEVRIVEQRWLDTVRRGFESYGYCSVETPSAEALEVLLAKGETSSEVYTLRRLQEDVAGAGTSAGPVGDASSAGSDSRLGLHFDLTVPFARYVAQHANDLVFPFKRYQIQRVWRGERPQEGRYREFTQCDIDVINLDRVPLSVDAEMPRIVHEVLTDLGAGDARIGINNRKVLQGFYEGLGAPDPLAVIRAVDKLDKIGEDAVRQILTERLGLSAAQSAACLELATVTGEDRSVVDTVADLGPSSPLLDEGLTELAAVLDALSDLPAGSVRAELSIARGLDYYTGTVYEGTLPAYPGYGSVCSGGRYDDLAGTFTRQHLPGVGISIGLTRLFAKLLAEGRLDVGRRSPSDLLVVVPSEAREPEAVATARRLRSRGLKVETYHEADKLGKQLRYASRKGIPFVWFPPFEDGRPHEVKDLTSGEQGPADPATWEPSPIRSTDGSGSDA